MFNSALPVKSPFILLPGFKVKETFFKGLNRGEIKMPRMCEICGKKPMTGHNVSHAHNLTKRRFNPNLQKVRALHSGRVKKIMVCTNCIKSGYVVKAP